MFPHSLDSFQIYQSVQKQINIIYKYYFTYIYINCKYLCTYLPGTNRLSKSSMSSTDVKLFEKRKNEIKWSNSFRTSSFFKTNDWITFFGPLELMNQNCAETVFGVFKDLHALLQALVSGFKPTAGVHRIN